MYNAIIEARFASEQQDIILVLYKGDEDNIIEEYIESGSIQHKTLVDAGWNNEKIVDCTADFKRQQTNVVRENLKQAARGVYKEEIDKVTSELARMRKQILEAQIIHKQKTSKYHKEIVQAELLTKRKKEEGLTRLAYLNKVEADFSNKVKSMNEFISKTIPTDDIEYSLTNIIEFLKVMNTSDEALKIIKNKSDKTKNSKSLLTALKHLI